MEIALLGGTGNLGKGLAMRFALLGHDILIGSRREEKAKSKADDYRREVGRGGIKIKGMLNEDAAKKCEIAFLTIPWEHAIETARMLRHVLRCKIVVSPLVPMKRIGDVFVYASNTSAAEMVASTLQESVVISALHTIPATRFANLKERFDWDVPVCGDDEEAKKLVMNLISQIDGLRALDAGPLSNSRLVESITPLILNLVHKNRIPEAGVKFL